MPDLSLKKLRYLNYAVVALILVSCLFLLRGIFSLSLSNKRTYELKKPGSGRNHPDISQRDIMSYAPIVRDNPFGPPSEFHNLERPGETDTHHSPSDLVLLGTVTGPKNLGYAVLLDKTRPSPARQELFALNEEVYSYGRLTNIQKDTVELTRGTTTFTIELADMADIKTDQAAAPPPHESPMIRQVSDNRYLLDQGEVQKALNSPEQIMTDARLYPNVENGAHNGFRLLEVKPGGLYENLGLKNSDILLRINGLALSSPEAAMQAMSSIQGMSSVNLDIIRNGKKMTLSYQVR